MNSLTANLHLLLVSFYRPAGARTALLIERHAFPSDRYAVESQVRFHGLDPARDLIEVAPRDRRGPAAHRRRRSSCIEREGARIATILLPGVQYLTGQALDIAAITAAGTRAQAASVGWDLAHAVGNVPLQMHDSGADFAVWCNYKYLNGGPGAVGGAFVHARHAHGHRAAALRRLVGPRQGDALPHGPGIPADSRAPKAGSSATRRSWRWRRSSASLRALRRGRHAGAAAQVGRADGLFRATSCRRGSPDASQIVTPAESARSAARPCRCGCWDCRAIARAQVFDGLRRRGILPDWREPDVIRAAPVPFYNRYDDVWRFVDALRAELDAVAERGPQ